MTTRLEYAVGLHTEPGTELAERMTWLHSLPETVPEKHDMMAHLLLLAVRKEWEAAERLRNLAADRKRRQEAAAKRKKRPK